MACQFDKRLPELERNLKFLYTQSIEQDRLLGRLWYPNAQQIMREWAEHYKVSVETAACVTAAISPQCAWERNLIIADDILNKRTPSIGGIWANIRKAIAIRASDEKHFSISDRMRYSFPCGPKVNSFACNLAGINSVVTVDTHALQAALNDPRSTYTLKWGPYAVFAAAYVNVALQLDIVPTTFQAIIWHVWKRLWPKMAKHAVRKQWDTDDTLED